MKELEELRKAVVGYDNGEVGYKAVVNAARAATLALPHDALIPAGDHARLLADRDYYRGLVVRVGNMIGEPAHIADDGTRRDDVLCAKVPGLVHDILLSRSGYQL